MRFGLISLALASALALAFAGGSTAGSNPDNDGDGVFNLVDNCVNQSVGNAGQADVDQDGFGNSCDGDYNQTATVNVTDFNGFNACFLNCATNTSSCGVDTGIPNPFGAGNIPCTIADHDGSNSVNITDFNLFLPTFLSGKNGESGLPCARQNSASDPNMTGRHPCVYTP